MKSALVLVDLQRDFLPGGALAVPEGDRVVPLANRLARRFGLVVATQDWHPPDHVSFAANHPGRSPGDVIEIGELHQVLWPVHCVQFTPGAAFAPGLDTSRISRIFAKGTQRDVDSYSGFFDNLRRRSTGLGEFLEAQQVAQVYVLGLATDYCVRATALDARSLGFDTRLVVDACRGVELHPGDVQRALTDMQRAGVELVHSGELLG
jgi:nicotinamidase/pyrazinamidase